MKTTFRFIHAPSGGSNTRIDKLVVSLGQANDEVAVDGLSSTLSLSALGGDDTITIGQLYNAPHTFHDQVERTTDGYLSSAGTQSIIIYAGDGDDSVRILKNGGIVEANGDCGNDNVSQADVFLFFVCLGFFSLDFF